MTILRVDIAADMVLIQRLLRILVSTTALALLVSGVAFLVLEAAHLWDWPLPVASAGIGLSSALFVAALGRRLLSRAELLLSAPVYDPATTDDRESGSLNSADDAALTTGDTCLTPHELEVLEHLARGLTNKEIARQLGRSAKTVEKHVAAIYTKLAVHSRLQAVTVARHRGLVRPE